VISGQKFEHLNSVRHRDEAWLKILESSIAVKVRIVAEDPLEQGIRKLLNFGHSIGHALESYFLETEHPITHGEAVAIGMICELPPSPLRAALMDTLRPVFGHQNIPVSAFPRIWELMLQDKKNEAGQVNMAVPAEQPFALRMEKMEEAVLVRRLAGYNGLGC
jgi:3-dehydroquinate synthase